MTTTTTNSYREEKNGSTSSYLLPPLYPTPITYTPILELLRIDRSIVVSNSASTSNHPPPPNHSFNSDGQTLQPIPPLHHPISVQLGIRLIISCFLLQPPPLSSVSASASTTPSDSNSNGEGDKNTFFYSLPSGQ